MKSSACIVLFSVAALFVQRAAHAQENLFSNGHLYWEAAGDHDNEGFGMHGLSYLGTNDSTNHALAIGTNSTASYILNRFPLDTIPKYKFPGQFVKRGFINSDTFPDFVCLEGNQIVTVLFGTIRVDSFDTALVLDAGRKVLGYSDSFVLTDCDGDGHDDLILFEPSYSDLNIVGRIAYFKGGDTLSKIPTEERFGHSDSDWVGGLALVGKVRDTAQRFVVELRQYAHPGGNDTVSLFLYPLGAAFSLTPRDSVILRWDSSRYFSGTGCLSDIDNDGVDEVLLGMNQIGVVPVFKLAGQGEHYPYYFFHIPNPSGVNKIVDLGDVTGFGYRTLLFAQKSTSLGGYMNGAVFLFNIGKALKDKQTALAWGPGFEDAFGTDVLNMHDVTGDNRNDFLIARDGGDIGNIIHMGIVDAFAGSSSFGPPVGVNEGKRVPTQFTLNQNYPNPCSAATDITFAVNGAAMHGAEVTLKIFDIMGREVMTAFRGTVDGYGYTVRVNGSSLPSGEFVYCLSSGGKSESKRMCVVH